MPSKVFLVGGETIKVADEPAPVRESLGQEPVGWVRLQAQGSDGDVWLKVEHVAAIVEAPSSSAHFA